MNRRDFLKSSVAATAVISVPSSFGLAEQEREIVRYPDPWIEMIDPRFERMIVFNAAVERLYTGARWAEGPVWFGDGRFLLWSDIPNNRILRWTEETGQVSVSDIPPITATAIPVTPKGAWSLREAPGDENGTGRHDTVLMDRFQGKRLNSPNDVVVHPDGHIWFTDPGYGIMSWYEGEREPFELPTRTYRLNPDTGGATVVNEDIEKPNGICFSPDFKKLYIVDTEEKPGQPHNIFVFNVVDGARLANRRAFHDMGAGGSDGIRCDREGNLWASAGWGGEKYDGVHIIAPDGKLTGKIHLPEACANLCFGGTKKNRLFITASQSLYAVYVEAQGAQVW